MYKPEVNMIKIHKSKKNDMGIYEKSAKILGFSRRLYTQTEATLR